MHSNFERLKQNEGYQNKIEWSVRRELAKINYRIHTDSIKENIVPSLTEKQKQDVSNVFDSLMSSETINNIIKYEIAY